MQYQKQIKTSVDFLKKGKTILYPTDTVWGIGCDATDVEAVEKIYQIKNRNKSKSLILLVSDLEMLKSIITTIPKQAIDFLSKNTSPTTIIYSNPVGIAKNAVAEDHTVGIRIVKDEFCQRLIKDFGKPIISTSANLSGEKTPKHFEEISDMIKKKVDHIVAYRQKEILDNPSTIVKIIDNSFVIIRE
jgi:L-threonylcarbamoyladenylate synthase